MNNNFPGIGAFDSNNALSLPGPSISSSRSRSDASPDLRAIHGCLQDIKLKLTSLDDLVARVNSLHTMMSDVAERVDCLAADQASLDRRVTSLEQRLTGGRTSIVAGSVPRAEVTQRFERMERSTRDFELVISGLPDNSNAGLLQTIKSVADAIKIPFAQSQVASALRLRHAKAKYKPLVIRFTSTFTRDEWISKKRAKKDLRACEIDPSWPDSLIYINERSTASERSSLLEARKLAKDHNFKFVWMKRGIVYLRKDDGAPVRRFTSSADFVEELSTLPPVLQGYPDQVLHSMDGGQ